jgi:pyruvate dehydrogenase E2 component (dihydrolipoamide acetyltransferase)
MTIEVRMPKLSDNMEQGTIIRWYKQPGDRVIAGEPLAEVETDKADVEMEASDSGVLTEIAVAEGQSAPVGAVIARLSDASEMPAAAAATGAPPAEPPPLRETERAAPPPPRSADGGTSPVRASPQAWQSAQDLGVNLDTVKGTGPGRRITTRDVKAAARRARPPGPAAPPVRQPEAPKDDAERRGSRLVPHSRMREAIAARMAQAKREIPHFYLTSEIDMSETMRVRQALRQVGGIPGLTVTHLILRALALALREHPETNAAWQPDGVTLYDEINIGIAVAVDDGLLVPVLRDVDRLSVAQIAAGATALVERARTGKFGSEGLSGATFTLSNVGMLDIDVIAAVINPPQAALLAVGAVKERPVVRDGRLAIAKTMHATLSCDHRVLDGVTGGRFLETVKRLLETPALLLLG